MEKQTIVIETQRLVLRHLTRDDTDALLEMFSDPIAMRFFPITQNREETQRWIDGMRNRYLSDGFGFYACILKETGDCIGYCGPLLQKDVDGVDEIEVGYGLIRKYWRKGYATEAAKGAMTYAFDFLGAKRVISLVRPENTPSIGVARRNHMQVEKQLNRFGYTYLVFMLKAPFSLS